MGAVSVEVDGLRQLVRGLEQAGVELEDLKDVFGTIADYAAETAGPFTPHRSGALRATVRGNRAKNKAVVMFGRGKVKYAGPAIYGWPARNIRGAQTIARTDTVLEHQVPRLLDQGLDQLLNKIGLT